MDKGIRKYFTNKNKRRSPSLDGVSENVTNSEDPILNSNPKIRKSDDIISTTNNETKINKAYGQKFREEWLENPKYKNWLLPPKNSEGEKSCRLCRSEIKGGLFHLNRHYDTDMHKKNEKIAKNTVSITSYQKNVEELEEESTIYQAKKAELMLSVFLCEHNLPFSIIEHLVELLKTCFPDSKILEQVLLNRKKTTKYVTDVIGEYFEEQISKDLRNDYFCLTVDESTDTTTQKSLVINVRYFDYQQGKVQDRFFGLLPMKESTSQSIYENICNHIKQHNVSLKNIIGFSADNCSTMMGENNGVQAKLKSDPNTNKTIFIQGCVCHLLHLCAQAAFAKLPNEIETFIEHITSYFSCSSKRMEKLKEFQDYFSLKNHKLLKSSKTRWLSLEASINRILEQWIALSYFFTDEEFELRKGNKNNKNQNSLYKVLFISKNLRSKTFKQYFLFLSYILELINKVNTEFQSSGSKLVILSPRIKHLFKLMIRNFIKKDFIPQNISEIDFKNNSTYIPLYEIYFGGRFSLTPQNDYDYDTVRMNCLNFYVEMCSKIKEKFNFKSEILNFFPNLTPDLILSGNITDIAPLVKYFPLNEKDCEKVFSEWRALFDCPEIEKFEKCDLEEFWYKISKLKNTMNEYMFRNIGKIVCSALAFPHSSADVERVFSVKNHIKTKERNSLKLETIFNILLIKDGLKTRNENCFTWKPLKELILKKISYAKENENEKD